MVGVILLRPRKLGGNSDVKLTHESMWQLMPMLVGSGFAVGLLSSFSGIGGSFLIVPGLMAATGMPLIDAFGPSLVSVASFSLTTAASYAWSGPVDRILAGLFIAGFGIGYFIGIKLAHRPATSMRSPSPSLTW